jgi:hypothetical protein
MDNDIPYNGIAAIVAIDLDITDKNLQKAFT